MRSKVKSNKLLARLSAFLVVLMLMCPMGVFAAAPTAEQQAHIALTTSVQANMANNSYGLEDGGTITGKDLFDKQSDNSYDLNEANFNRLSKTEQTKVVNDIATYSQQEVSDGKNNVSETTVNNWWKQLQSKNGVGSKFMNVILQNTKPDFVSANRFWAPFQGPLGTALGILSVGIMICLGFVIAMDIFYICIPPFRMFVTDSDNTKEGKIKVSNLISHDAILAVEMAENNNDGTSKQALGIYFKRHAVMLILVGICLLYLVQGQLYVLVGMILDLVSGTLGF